MQKGTLERHDEEITHSAFVTLTTVDGRQFALRVAGARGSSPAIPLPDNLIEQKFLDCASRILPAAEAQALYHRLLQDDFR